MVRLDLARIEGGRLRITVTEPRTGQSFYFDNTSAGSANWAAVLLFDRLNEEISNRVRDIRKEAYDAGWKAAKAHDTKAAWFSSCINNKLNGGPV